MAMHWISCISLKVSSWAYIVFGMSSLVASDCHSFLRLFVLSPTDLRAAVHLWDLKTDIALSRMVKTILGVFEDLCEANGCKRLPTYGPKESEQSSLAVQFS